MKKILFIVNPIAGGRDKGAVVSAIDRYLDKGRFEYSVEYTKGPGDATSMAAESDADIVCAVGGDGTQNEVARGLFGTGKVLAIIPCGSGDGYALHLGISRKLRKAVETINNGTTITSDAGSIDGEPFLCTCGMGIDAIVSWRFSESGKRGLKTYVVEALKTWKGFVPDHYHLDIDGFNWEGDASIVCIGNANQWGNRAKITPLASVTDGLLEVTVVKKFKTIDIPALVIRLMRGTLHKSRHVESFKGKNIRIVRNSDGPFHFDGDPGLKGKEISVIVKPSAIKVNIKKKNINVI